MDLDQLGARRAIEALRSGVPSRDAVRELGSGQNEIEDRFLTLLDGSGTSRRGGQRGLLLGGGFGAGKSHVLEHLAHLALERGFVVSRVVISKETPLHDPVKVLKAAVETATLPTGSFGAVAEAAAVLDSGSPAFAELLQWASGSGSSVSERFALSLSLLPTRRRTTAISPRPSFGSGPATRSGWPLFAVKPALPARASRRSRLCRPGNWPVSGFGS